jgi:phosphomannomutase
MSSLKINPAIFREYDIRGIAGEDLSATFARHLGAAYASEVRN